MKDGAEAFIFYRMQIQGRVVVVTGGSNGIGRALAKAFASQEARAVVIADQDEKSGQQVAHEI
ncbi:MAG TPA: SDR family NAD(P)-dependent oxidoreductase, partial [Acidobacteriota bacterium]|nr:SDR family NAD(P)-dependent oxidoreductase [Acidobacteriota bacterium]